jgi:flagellar biosynthesis component FlhA
MELETDVDMSELANLPPVSVSLKTPIPHFVFFFVAALYWFCSISRRVSASNCLNRPSESVDNHEQLKQTEPQTEQNLQVFAQQHEPEPVPEQPINTTSLGRFKQLDADALLEVSSSMFVNNSRRSFSFT